MVASWLISTARHQLHHWSCINPPANEHWHECHRSRASRNAIAVCASGEVMTAGSVKVPLGSVALTAGRQCCTLAAKYLTWLGGGR